MKGNDKRSNRLLEKALGKADPEGEEDIRVVYVPGGTSTLVPASALRDVVGQLDKENDQFVAFSGRILYRFGRSQGVSP